MSYTPVDGKPSKDLVSYQSVRGADIKEVYGAVVESTPIKQLYSDFVRPEADTENVKYDSVDNSVRFLHATDFLRKPSEDILERVPNQPYAELPFELRMFHHLRQQEGEQEHFMELHRILAETDRRFVNKDDLVEDLNRELGSYALNWNEPKVKTWYDLMSPLGLTSVQDNYSILTAPCPRVVYDLLKVFVEREGSNRIREALDWIEKEFFYCYAERGGGLPRIHTGLSETLATLDYYDAVSLKSTSDAVHEVAIPALRADKTSSFKLHTLPRRPAFQYPLESHELIA